MRVRLASAGGMRRSMHAHEHGGCKAARVDGEHVRMVPRFENEVVHTIKQCLNESRNELRFYVVQIPVSRSTVKDTGGIREPSFVIQRDTFLVRLRWAKCIPRQNSSDSKMTLRVSHRKLFIIAQRICVTRRETSLSREEERIHVAVRCKAVLWHGKDGCLSLGDRVASFSHVRDIHTSPPIPSLSIGKVSTTRPFR